MFALFMTVFEMSVKSAIVIAFVLLLRILLSKAPKRFSYLLWSVVGIRLSVPVGLSSQFSIFGIFDSVSQSDINAVQAQVAETAVEQGGTEFALNLFNAVPWVWVIGFAVMLVYGAVSYVRMHIKMQTAMILNGNIYESDRISSPFALGIIKPRIYLPVGLNPIQQGCVIAHEKYHIKRFDHVVKLISFLLLAVHWFNPLCWVAFRKMTMDMEMSCDEGVLGKSKDNNFKKLYSKTLLDIGTGNRSIVPNPVSFDGGVAKKRIMHVLRYKAPKLPTVAFCYAMCLAVIFVCSTDTKADSRNLNKVSDIIAGAVSENSGDESLTSSEQNENVDMVGSVKYIGGMEPDSQSNPEKYYVSPNYR